MTYESALGGDYSPEQWSAFGSMVQAAATGMTLLVAVAAAIYAKRQVREARAQVDEARRTREADAERAATLREEQARPFVVVDIEQNPVAHFVLDLVFRNVGTTLARNVTFTFDPPLDSTMQRGADRFLSSALFTSGIPAMPPGKELRCTFDVGHQRYPSDLPRVYTVTVNSDDSLGQAQPPLEYVLDLNVLFGLSQIGEKTVHDLAKSAEEVAKTLKSWTERQSGVRVWTIADVRARDREDEERWQQHLAEQAEAADGESPPVDADT